MTIFSSFARSCFVLRFASSVPALSATLFAVIAFGLPAFGTSPELSAAEPANKSVRRAVVPKDPVAREKYLAQVMLEAKITNGKELFHREWMPHEGKQKPGDGLGPLYNERSCARCHKLGSTGGAGPAENNVQLLVVQKLKAGDKWETTHLAQRAFLLPTATSDTFLLHRYGTSPDYEQWRRERLSLTKPNGEPEPAVSDEARVGGLMALGLDLPRVARSRSIGGGSFVAVEGTEPEKPSLVTLTLEERNTTALFGAGLIDKVQEETLAAVAAEQATTVRGRIPRTAGRKLGRFGWKGQNESLLEFNAGACAAELGLDTAAVRQAKLPTAEQSSKPYAGLFNISKGIDIEKDQIAELSEYVASLPAPKRPENVPKIRDVREGEEHFVSVGCAQCHRKDVGEISEIYSDLLLHQVGLRSFGGSYYGPPLDLVESVDPKRTADPEEFRTPPLWGVADSAPYLHDGRAKTLEEAILAHAGQATFTTAKYSQLHANHKRQLLAFLGSLKAPKLH